jgi:hypothetical protein
MGQTDEQIQRMMKAAVGIYINPRGSRANHAGSESLD